MPLQLTSQETAELIHSLRKYFREEFDEELTELKAKLLLDYVQKEIAPFAYNCGVKDADQFLRAKVEDLSASCFEPGLTYWQKQRR